MKKTHLFITADGGFIVEVQRVTQGASATSWTCAFFMVWAWVWISNRARSPNLSSHEVKSMFGTGWAVPLSWLIDRWGWLRRASADVAWRLREFDLKSASRNRRNRLVSAVMEMQSNDVSNKAKTFRVKMDQIAVWDVPCLLIWCTLFDKLGWNQLPFWTEKTLPKKTVHL